MIEGALRWLEGLSVKKLYALALVSACLCAFFALAPRNFGWLFFIFVPFMMAMVDVVRRRGGGSGGGRQVFWLGFAFGFGYNFIAFYWIGYAFLLSPVPFLMPLSTLGLPSLFGLYWGIGFWAAARFWSSAWEKVLSFTFFWTLCFWMQGFLWTGFPWNFPAQSWAEVLPLAQNFHWLGIYGATFIMILASASFFMLLTPTKKKYLVPALVVVFFSGLWGYGSFRLNHEVILESEVRVIMIQPNIPQVQKWDRRYAKSIVQTYFKLSQQGVKLADPTLQNIMIWPEAALPVNIEKAASMRRAIGDMLPPDMLLYAGFAHSVPGKHFNSLFVFDDEGKIIHRYDKNHLVPLGEYIPFQNFFSKLGARQVSGGGQSALGFSAGTTRDLLPQGALPSGALPRGALPLVCFEISFPEEIQRHPDLKWLVNITNDGWYGTSPGPYQHFQLAVIRAIEFGVPVVRVANTGISAVISPLGQVQVSAPLEAQAVLGHRLPAPLAGSTFYAQVGEWLFVFFLVITGLVLLTFSSKKQNK